MTKTFSFQQIAVPKVLSEEVREAISNNVLQFYVRDQQQEAQDEGITALYERLSQEDKLEGESNSIANQKKILERYCREHGITAYRHYDEDDGYSGTNFNRPGFQRMLADIKAGKIKRVIVKDMSRFGRDYLQVGFYTDMLFPDFGVHFIAVNDGVDSTRGENEFTAIRNVFNEMYARDTSKKIRATWQSKGKSGEHLTTIPPYGYMKDPEDKNHLIPDPETAPVVQRIFSMVADGYSFRYIARTLASENILTPSAYRGLAPRSPLTRSTDWNPISLAGMIRDPQYLGKLVYGRKKKVSYKSRKQISTSEQEQIVVDNTHEPLVSQEIWELANDVANRNHKTTKTGKPHLFSGLLYCADCDSAMAVGAYQTFVCRRYKSYNRSENGCTSHSIPYKVLYAAVLTSIQEVTQAAQLDREALINRLSGIGHKKQQAALASARREQAKAEKRLTEIGELIRKAFEKNTLGSLPDDVYKELVDGYTKERGDLQGHFETLTKQIADLSEQTESLEKFVSLVEEYIDIQTLDRDILHRLIDKIKIGQSYTEQGVKYYPVDIYFRFVGKIQDSTF